MREKHVPSSAKSGPGNGLLLSHECSSHVTIYFRTFVRTLESMVWRGSNIRVKVIGGTRTNIVMDSVQSPKWIGNFWREMQWVLMNCTNCNTTTDELLWRHNNGCQYIFTDFEAASVTYCSKVNHYTTEMYSMYTVEYWFLWDYPR